jgi:ATP-dependent helicase HrpB
MRMDSRVGPEGRIEVVTEGVLTRRLQKDPALSGVGLVIFDEYHERSLEADLALALCLDIQGALNDHLKLLVMSATFDPEPVARLLGQAPVVTCAGRSFPVETVYCGRRQARSREADVVAAILQAAAEGPGGILVFLPGAGEIRRVVRRLEAVKPGPQWRITPLYGNLTREQQDKAIAPAPAGQRKIVLATAIAETSLTIEGIDVVVDSGLSRVARFDPGSGMTRLVTLPVTRASADQRRGRAGRLGPGRCYRLWSRESHRGLVPQARPAIAEADMAPLLLELAMWGVRDASQLQWRDPPPEAATRYGRELLMQLEALDSDGHISAHGRQMAELPMHPRLAHMVLMAIATGEGALACDLAALLSERDILHTRTGPQDADLGTRLELMDDFRRTGRAQASAGSLDIGACRRVLKVARDLRRRLGCRDDRVNSRMAGRLLAWAYPDRIAQRRRGGRGRFRLSGGKGAFLDPMEPLAAEDFLVAATLDGDRREARIFLAAAIDIADLTVQFDDKMQWVARVDWDAARETVRAQRQLTLGKLCLKTEPLTAVDAQSRKEALLKGIRLAGLDCLPWTKRLRRWQARVLFLRRVMADYDPWPDVSDAALLETLEAWLGPFVDGYSRLKDLRQLDLTGALRAHLSWSQQQRLDALAPTHLVVPSGSRRPIDYHGETPLLAVRIQEMFGARATPVIAEGRQALLLHLLSPAGRPAQITRDLAGFWQNSYADVKKELQGRYPKHYWPDDPLNAAPTARARPA